MAITLEERALDLLYSGQTYDETSTALGITHNEIQTIVQNLALTPSAEKITSGLEPISLASSLGGLVQTGLTARPARSNAFGLNGTLEGALAATGVGCFVPVGVQVGDVISKVNIITSSTAGGTMTHQFGAIYSGFAAEPALIEQSTDTTNAAIAEKTLLGWTLTAPVKITAAMAPHGFIYAEVAITATTIPTAMVFNSEAIVNFKIGTNGPLFTSFTAGSALAGTAAATTGSPSAKVVAPVVILT